MDPRERLAALRENPQLQQMFLGEQAVRFRAIDWQAAGRVTAGFQAAQQGDAVARERAALERFPAGVQQSEAYRQQVQQQQAESRKKAERLGGQQERYEKALESSLEGAGTGERIVSKIQRGLTGAYIWSGLADFFEPGEQKGTYYERLSAATMQGGADWALREQQTRNLIQGRRMYPGGLLPPPPAPGLPPPPAPPAPPAETLAPRSPAGESDIQHQQLHALKEQTQALREIRGTLEKQAAAPRRNRPAQAQLDVHAEP